jgi:hypothetical protein
MCHTRAGASRTSGGFSAPAIGACRASAPLRRRGARPAARCLIAVVALLSASTARAQAPSPAPRILIDQPLRAVEYQLARLSNEDLVRLERTPDDARYRPVYMALLTRRGLTRSSRDDAIAAIVKLDRTAVPDVLVQALARVPDDDDVTAGWLVARLLAEPVETLRERRALFDKAIADGAPAHGLAAAYAVEIVLNRAPAAAWKAAADRGHLTALVRGLPHLPAEDATRAVYRELFDAVAALALESTDAAAQSAAVRSLLAMPPDTWPAGRLEPLARAVVARVRGTPASRRTEPAVLDAVELGGRLADALPPAVGRPLRREIDDLGVAVVRIAAVPEEMRFDRPWFVVEAGRPVEIVLINLDAMPHNLVVGTPGSLDEIGVRGSAMPMPADPAAKPFVPDLPSVLFATALVASGGQARLAFTAPSSPGEYLFVCTFPGHWLRMYGVMLVVGDLDAWRSAPTPPIDPMTKQPYRERSMPRPGS